jgi:hypothetical protein
MTKTLEFLRPRKTLKVPIRAPASVDRFRQFVVVLEDRDVEQTNANVGILSLLCDEYRFFCLSEPLSAFQQSAFFK